MSITNCDDGEGPGDKRVVVEDEAGKVLLFVVTSEAQMTYAAREVEIKP